jgi:hypothetical protein
MVERRNIEEKSKKMVSKKSRNKEQEARRATSCVLYSRDRKRRKNVHIKEKSKKNGIEAETRTRRQRQFRAYSEYCRDRKRRKNVLFSFYLP